MQQNRTEALYGQQWRKLWAGLVVDQVPTLSTAQHQADSLAANPHFTLQPRNTERDRRRMGNANEDTVRVLVHTGLFIPLSQPPEASRTLAGAKPWRIAFYAKH